MILEASIEYFSLRPDQAEAALEGMKRYLPLVEGLEQRVELLRETPGALTTLLREGPELPRAIRDEVLRSRRFTSLSAMRDEHAREIQTVAGISEWKGPMAAELTTCTGSRSFR